MPFVDVDYTPWSNKKPPPPGGWGAGDVDAPFTANPVSPGAAFPVGTPQGAASATPFSGAAQSFKIPGYDPDYANLIKGDPNLIAGGADLNFFEGQLTAGKRAAIRRAVIEAGLSPGGAIGDIDEATLYAAGQNKWSSAAELGRSRDRSGADLGASLAARGILSSGGLVGGSERIQEGFERGTSSLTSRLLDLISGYEGDFAGKMAGVKGDYRALREAAALRIQGDPRYQPIGEADAVLDPVSGLYMTPDGRWYDKDQKRVPAPVAGQGAQTPAEQIVPELVAPGGSTVAPPGGTPFISNVPGTVGYKKPLLGFGHVDE